MNRSKEQAVYKYLPGMWVSDNTNSGRTITAKIDNWYWQKMPNIYDKFIVGEIKRQIMMFGERNGDISSFDVSENRQSFLIVEVAGHDDAADIKGTTSPLVFYCSSCGDAFSLRSADSIDRNTWRCSKCGKYSIKQLQMVYACECGHAEPIRIPFVPGVSEFKYRPNEPAAKFKMFYKKGMSEKTAEFFSLCPNCNSRLLPDNATANRNYRPFTLRIINLVDHRSGEFYDKGIEAQKTVLARWFNQISVEAYEKILSNIELAFSEEFRSDSQRRAIEEQVRSLVRSGMIPESQFDAFVNQMLGANNNEKSVEKYVIACDKLFGRMKSENTELYERWINNFSFKLMQYYTLKDAKRVITLQDSISRQIEMEFIESEEEVHSLNHKLGIANMQVSCDVQIVNCTYGFTRRAMDPKKSNNKNCRLKLNAFSKTRDENANLVYSAKLDTEGILFEIDQKRLIEWLFRNGIVSEELLPDMEDELSIKKWYAEYVHSDRISMFGEIEGQEEQITMNVFSLLHTISHAFIKTAGELSGLSGNSLMEMVLVETASIFIYAQSGQGVTLGALSGMVETNYAGFLKKAFTDSRSCVFDPICTERDDTACSACLIIPEVSCNYFNAALGRKYLYSIDEVESPKVGYWEM